MTTGWGPVCYLLTWTLGALGLEAHPFESLGAIAPVVIDEVTVIGSRCGPMGKSLEWLSARWVEVEPLIEATYPLADGAGKTCIGRQNHVVCYPSGHHAPTRRTP
ncbi:MAG: hypothetical protein RX318_09625 [bacterium]|nr:hypothetical protein [bacterium]